MERYAKIMFSLSIIALFLLLYILPLGVRPMIIPDEPRYAEISREMLVSGDWIVPRFNGLRYFEKPVLGYWPIAVSIGIFGASAFATRLPSALASGITALIVFMLLKKSGHGWREGFLAGMVFLTCVIVFALGGTNTLDSGFNLFITAALAAFFFADQAVKEGSGRSGRALAGGLVGLAFLIKGFIALAIPAIVIIPYLLWSGRGKEIFVNYWLPLSVAVLMALPWGLVIYFREPDFWHYFFWEEHLRRFLGSKAQHAEPFWYFLPVLAWGMFPWVMLLPAAVSGLVRSRARDPLLRFAVCWFLFPFLFFSVSRGKLPTYILPCFPALAILLTRGLLKYLRTGGKKMFNAGVIVLAGLLLLIMIGLVVVQSGITPFPKFFSHPEVWKWLISMNGLFIWLIFCYRAIREKKCLIKIVLFGAGPAVLFFSSHFIFPDLAGDGRAPGDFLKLHSPRVDPGTILVSDNYCTGYLCWFSGRSDVFLLESDGEFGYGLNYPDARGRQLRFERFRKTVEDSSRANKILLFLDGDRYLEFQEHFPRPLSIQSGDGFILAEF